MLAGLLLGCSPEQSKEVGNAPKKTLDRVTTDLNKNLQQGADRTREAEEKK